MRNIKKGVWQTSDAAVGIAIVFFVYAFVISPLINWYSEQQKMSVAAAQAKVVESAVNKYIADNYATIATTATPSSPYILTVPMLISSSYLPVGFSPANNYSSTYRTMIYEPTANKFHTMTFLTGGADLKLGQARKLAAMIGGSGGYIEGNVAKGAQGTWSENLSVFGGYNPGEGHIVISGFYVNGAIVNDYLYRKAVPGHPELNTMSTALNMGSNDVNAVKTLNATTANATTVNATGNVIAGASVIANGASISGNATVSGTMNASTTRTNGETYTGGWFRTTGDTGWYSEKWGGGLYMSDSQWIRTYNGKSIYSSGEIKGNTVTSEGRMTTGEFLQMNGVAGEGNGCSPNGLLGRDGSGASLSCTNGVWAKGGGGKAGYYCRYTSMSEGKSWDYIGHTPVPDKRCPVISQGIENGQCSCMPIMLVD